MFWIKNQIIQEVQYMEDKMKIYNLTEEIDSENIDKNKEIEIKKAINNFFRDARKKSKQIKCFYCGKPENKFCNSHSVPRQILENIKDKGEVLNTNSILNILGMDELYGVNKAGTFNMLCRNCDGKIFSEYENFDNYEERMNQKILAQIVMKISLKNLYRKINNYNEMEWLNEKTGNFFRFDESIDLDKKEYLSNFKKAKEINENPSKNGYYLFYYKELNYVVPIAFQDSVTLVSGLEGELINDLHCLKDSYKTKEIYICVFPLKEKTIILMFIDSDSKRYRTFYKKFKKLDENEKLEVINYIMFLYSENIFISPKVKGILEKDEKLKEITEKTSNILKNPLEILLEDNAEMQKEQRNYLCEEYRLDNREKITNLLEEKYKLR